MYFDFISCFRNENKNSQIQFPKIFRKRYSMNEHKSQYTNWIFNFIFSYIYPRIGDARKSKVFLIFQQLFSYKHYPIYICSMQASKLAQVYLNWESTFIRMIFFFYFHIWTHLKCNSIRVLLNWKIKYAHILDTLFALKPNCNEHDNRLQALKSRVATKGGKRLQHDNKI
jgi:hypothetical protein